MIRSISGEDLYESKVRSWSKRGTSQSPPQGSCQLGVYRSLSHPWPYREPLTGTGDQLQINLHVAKGSSLSRKGKENHQRPAPASGETGNNQGRKSLYCCAHRVAEGTRGRAASLGNGYPHRACLQLLWQDGGLGCMEAFSSQPDSPKDLGFTPEPSPFPCSKPASQPQDLTV